MMEFELNAKSWHFWLANFSHKRVSVYGSDICSYIRAVLLGLFWFILFSTAGVLFVVGTGVALYDGYQFFTEGLKVSVIAELMIMLWSIIFVLIFTLLFTAGVVEYVIPAAQRAAKSVSKSEKPSFLRLAYRKFKDKTCFQIKFK
jgi:hypothetical protein